MCELSHFFLQLESMSKEGREPQEVDLKFLFKAFNDQFKMLNTRLDDLESSSGSKLPKWRYKTWDVEEEDVDFIM